MASQGSPSDPKGTTSAEWITTVNAPTIALGLPTDGVS